MKKSNIYCGFSWCCVYQSINASISINILPSFWWINEIQICAKLHSLDHWALVPGSCISGTQCTPILRAPYVIVCTTVLLCIPWEEGFGLPEILNIKVQNGFVIQNIVCNYNYTIIYTPIQYLIDNQTVSRLITWHEAQRNCEKNNMTLFQYDTYEKYYSSGYRMDMLLKAFYATAIGTGDVVFLGLQENPEVRFTIFTILTFFSLSVCLPDDPNKFRFFNSNRLFQFVIQIQNN